MASRQQTHLDRGPIYSTGAIMGRVFSALQTYVPACEELTEREFNHLYSEIEKGVKEVLKSFEQDVIFLNKLSPQESQSTPENPPDTPPEV